MNRKPINVSGYTIGHRVSSWHNFMDTMATCVIWIFNALIVTAILATATIMIWGR